MDSANGVTCVICRDSICCDSAKSKRIYLTCGHAFGKSCMRKWVESSNQKKCLLCKNPLTDNEIKEIKNIPLQERVIIISEKAIKLFGQTILQLVTRFPDETPDSPAYGAVDLAITVLTGTGSGAAVGTIVVAGGVIGSLTGGVVGAATALAAMASGVAVGAVGAAAGVLDNAAIRSVTGAVAGFAGFVGSIGATAAALGAFGITAGDVGFFAGNGLVTAGAAGATAEALAMTAMNLGFADMVPGVIIGIPFGVAIRAGDVLGIGYFVGASAAASGAIGARIAYIEQEMNPVDV